MSRYAGYLKELLRPLRVYELEGTANGAELEAQGQALDGAEQRLEEIQREMLVSPAEGRPSSACWPGDR